MNPHSEAGATVGVVLADTMEGVREAWRWILEQNPRVAVRARTGTVAQTLAAPGDVVVCGLRFPDGTARDIVAAGRPAVVWVFQPRDERADVDLTGAAAILRSGQLRMHLADAVLRAAGACVPGAAAGRNPAVAAPRGSCDPDSGANRGGAR